MRLNAWLGRAGVASRRKADELIKTGRVTVNGEPGQLNTFVAASDVVELDGKPLAKQRLAYVLLHKPAGVITTSSDPRGRRTVIDLVDHPARVVPVGRLDADTTGALLLTNDGELAPARAPEPRSRQGLRRRRRGHRHARRTRRTRARRRARRRSHRARDGETPQPEPRRADDPRRPQAPGQAHACGRRPPRPSLTQERLCRSDPGGARARPMARARALRG